MPFPIRLSRLLVFNLMTDADDSILGFTTVWLNALAKHCDHIDVVTMQAGRLAVANNVSVYSVGREKGYSEVRRALEFYHILFELLRHNHYDACFAHMIQLFALMGAPLLKVWGIPQTLWYAHGAVPTSLRWAEKLVNNVVTSSPDGFRLSSPKVTVIGQGVDTTLFQPRSSEKAANRPFTLVSVGRIAPVKRLEVMIEAVRIMMNDIHAPKLNLRLVGNVAPKDTAYGQMLQVLVKQYSLADVVEFPGGEAYADVAREYQNADVMLNMSATGSMDKAVLEAMACGVPVVTANEAYRTMLAPWADALLTPPDSADELAARLEKLARMTDDERKALGLQLRVLVVEEHGLDRLIEKLMAILAPEGE